MDFVTVIGLFAGGLTTVGYVPQLLKIIRTKSTGDLSMTMFMILSVGVFLWLIYGLYINSFPVIAANAATLCLTVTIGMLKIKYSKQRTKTK